MGVPHLAVPLRLDGRGGFATVEQDSLDDIAGCVAACLATPVGSRVEVPSYGTTRGEFVGVVPAAVIAEVQEWEPRAELSADLVPAVDGLSDVASLTVQVRPYL